MEEPPERRQDDRDLQEVADYQPPRSQTWSVLNIDAPRGWSPDRAR